MNDTPAPMMNAAPDGQDTDGKKAEEAAKTAAIWPEVALKRHETDRTAWLITCVDLTSLLMGFFVLLFSLQTLQQDKWKEVTGSFQAQFSNNVNVVSAVPDGSNNAVIRVTSTKSGLAYLDALLHQRVEKDPLWSQLTAELNSGRNEMTYVVPPVAVADEAAWSRLGNTIRGWKNPVGIRLTTPKAQLAATTAKAVALAAKLANTGAMGVFVDIDVNDKVPQPQLRLVVRAK